MSFSRPIQWSTLMQIQSGRTVPLKEPSRQVKMIGKLHSWGCRVFFYDSEMFTITKAEIIRNAQSFSHKGRPAWFCILTYCTISKLRI
jgi:hypothetical protein